VPEQCPSQVPAYFRMWVRALLAPPSRRRARISPPAKSQAIRLPGNKPAAWRIAAGMLVVPLLVNIVSFVFTVRILLPVFLPVDPFSHFLANLRQSATFAPWKLTTIMRKPFSTELPDRFVEISDDIEAKAFLAALGILGELPTKSALANSGAAEIDTIAVAHYDHPTHWILAFRFHGNERQEDNGFAVFGWPKNRCPRSVIEDAIERQGLGDPDAFKISELGDDPSSLS